MKRVGKIVLAFAACALVATPAMAEKKVTWNLATDLE